MVAPRLASTLQFELGNILRGCYGGGVMPSQWRGKADPGILKHVRFLNIHHTTNKFAKCPEEYVPSAFKHDDRFYAFVKAVIQHDEKVRRDIELVEEGLKKDKKRFLYGAMMVICSRKDTCERVEKAFSDTIDGYWEEPTNTLVVHGDMYEYERAAATAKFEEGLDGGVYAIFTSQRHGKKLACKPAVICYDQPKFSKTNRLDDWLSMMSRTGDGAGHQKGAFITLLDPEDVADHKLILQIVDYFTYLGRDVPQWMKDVPPLHLRHMQSKEDGTRARL